MEAVGILSQAEVFLHPSMGKLQQSERTSPGLHICFAFTDSKFAKDFKTL